MVPADTSMSQRKISRCLKPGGCFVSITFAQPFFRKRLYARTVYNWSVRHDSYGEGFEYFVYVMTKGEQLSPEDAALEQRLLEEPKSQPTSCPTPQDEENNDFLAVLVLSEKSIIANKSRSPKCWLIVHHRMSRNKSHIEESH
ncbi:hypothetical protein CCH79_00005244 [Gambusia affinis]|uniref:Uncharacterized protein n=1 Tax=Gambusia affinis TaxID=33528 RepID=A0A315VPU1_GAMAF|nr:hypothetical protein CCH79_00005244 [Gambusia affinis]